MFQPHDISRSVRREFQGAMFRASLMVAALSCWGLSGALCIAETPDTLVTKNPKLLYNGIRLPSVWPPKNIPYLSDEPMPVPYLEAARIPKIIPIDVGRQLFVDDFLIESSSLSRTYHPAKKYAGNPVLEPEENYEQPFVSLSAHPVWYDSRERLFKMLYKAGRGEGRGAFLAVSEDGLHWERPSLHPGEARNRLYTEKSFGGLLTTLSLIPHPTEPQRGYVGLYGRLTADEGFLDRCDNFVETPDLLDWTLLGVAPKKVKIPSAGRSIHPYDVSRVIWNPFRNVWVYDIKQHSGPRRRCRFYRESTSFDDLWKLDSSNTVFWVGADRLDQAYPGFKERYGIDQLQLYDHDAIAYESLMLGSFTIWSGPENDICEQEQVPKVTQMTLGYSRDGFHWHRPERAPFIGVDREAGPGAVDFGYIRPAGRVCLVVGDELYFYYSTASGVGPNGQRGIYQGRSVSVATLRRDGFASLDAGAAGGSMTTRPVRFSGKHLFVNLKAPEGALRVELLNRDGEVIPGFSLEDCLPVQADSTRQAVSWKSGQDLSSLADEVVRFRFELRSGELYSFWVSADASGASGGYLGAGGPGYSGLRDLAEAN